MVSHINKQNLKDCKAEEFISAADGSNSSLPETYIENCLTVRETMF